MITYRHLTKVFYFCQQENGKQKCQRYWPEEKGSKQACKYGDYHVTLKFVHDSGSYVTRGLVLKHRKLKKERLVWHLQYTDWPDHGCPEDTYGFLGKLNSGMIVWGFELLDFNKMSNYTWLT